MKELLLQAVLDAGTCGITPPALCRWLIALTGGPVEGATGNARKFYHTPCPDVLEIWFQDTLSQQAENVICYSRISFRPLLPASAATSSTATDCRIAVEVLPPEQIYTSIPLSEMGLVGASPRLVAVDGWVVPHGSLSRGPMGSLNRAYAVLTPALTARLGVSFHTEQQAAVSAGPYDVLRQEVERLLSLCFPGGGEVEGCPLHVSLRLNEVSADCLLNTNADHRLLRFGSSGEGSAPRSAFPLYGARQPGRYRYLNITMLYPRGELETARRLFLLFAPTASLIAVEPVGDVDRWVPYDVDDHAVDTLTQALYHQSGMDAPGVGRLYCLLTPSGSVAGTLLRQQLSVRLRRLVRSLGAFYWGPVPLHAIGGEAFSRHLPAVASRLLVQMGGVPWVPRCFASQNTDLIVGCSHSRLSQSFEPFCAATFYNDPLQFCHCDLCKPAERFPLFFPEYFQMAYGRFCTAHDNHPPERLVIYCHHDFPVEPLASFVAWMGKFPAAVPVVWVRVRRTTGAQLRHYAPDAPGGMPPAGTCLRLDDDTFLLFCRDFVPSPGSRGGFYPYPLEVNLKCLCPDGQLLSLSPEEVEGVLVQACQLVWANPECLDGNPLPLVLSHTDRLVRHHCQERRVEVADRNVIREEFGNLAF